MRTRSVTSISSSPIQAALISRFSVAEIRSETQTESQLMCIWPVWCRSSTWSRKSNHELAIITRVPATVAVAATRPRLPPTARTPRGRGPNQRCARTNATSTATTYTGSSSVDSWSQVENGAEVRSMAPTAPRNTTSQNPFTKASTTAKGSTCDQATAARVLSRPVAAVTSGSRVGASPAPDSAAYRVSVSVFGVIADLLGPPCSRDRPAEHHGVVLVGEVVAVGDIGAREVADPAVDDHRLARVEGHQVLAGDVVGVTGVRSHRHVLAGPHDRAVLLHVEVEGVHPAAAAVADLPEREAALLLLGQRSLPARVLQALQVGGRVEGLAVDQPLDLAGQLAALDLEDEPVG